MSYHLIDVVQSLGQPRVLVLGDLILDRYIWGDAERVSQEAPVILLREQDVESRPGGAANVANMLRGLEARVCMAGVVGADADGEVVRQSLVDAGVDCSALLCDSSRPTTVKQRFLGRAQYRYPHQMLRVDRETRAPLSAEVAAELLVHLRTQLDDCQAVLISDYGKGVCTPEVTRQLISEARNRGIPVIVDPPSSGSLSHCHGATAVTPNRLETHRATGRPIENAEDAFAAGRQLCATLDLDYAFVTLDSDGIALTLADGTSQLLSTRRREVFDITGAGDMVLAMIGLGAAAGVAPDDLARLANVAGGLEVEHVGVVTVRRDEITADLLRGGRSNGEKICDRKTLVRQVEARRGTGQRIVLTNGCFDLLHTGHVRYLKEAAAEGDCLVVAINSDASIRGLNKAPDRPLFSQEDRAEMLAALESVDYVVVFDEATPHALLEEVQPDLLVKGGTYSDDEIVGREVVLSYGGQVKPMGVTPGVSTTTIVERLRASAPGGPAAIPFPEETDKPVRERKAG